MKKLGTAALLTVLWSVLMLATLTTFVPYPYEHHFHQDVNSPILAIELAYANSAHHPDVDQVLKGLPQGQGSYARAVRAVGANTILDLVFIVIYVWYFLVLTRSTSGNSRFLKAVATMAILAGLFDYVEDGFIFAVLSGVYMPVVIPSLIKWSLFAVTLLGIGILLARSSGAVYSLASDRLLGVGHLMAGALILVGVITGWHYGYSAIEAGSAIFAITVLWNAVYPIATWFFGLLPGNLVVYVDDFCQRRKRGEVTGPAVQRGGNARR